MVNAVSRLRASFKNFISTCIWTCCFDFRYSLKKQSARGIENRFVKAAAKVLRADELDRAARVPNERPQNPANLAAQKQVPGEPGQQHITGDRGTAGNSVQQAEPPDA